jgi:hypothetical protein
VVASRLNRAWMYIGGLINRKLAGCSLTDYDHFMPNNVVDRRPGFPLRIRCTRISLVASTTIPFEGRSFLSSFWKKRRASSRHL